MQGKGIVKRTLGLGLGLAAAWTLVGCATKAPDWTFTDATGAIRNLSDYEGKILVLAFSNSWCDPCQEAAVQMQMLHVKFGDHGVKVVYVSSWERGDPATYMQEHGFNYGLMVNATEIARDYDVNRVPTFFVVGTDGAILFRNDGWSKGVAKQITRTIEKHLGSVEPDMAAHSG